MIEKYYKILEVTPEFTVIDLKKAYKKKALVLHPDVNKDPNAHEQFIFLTEAFEYLHNKKTHKIFNNKSNSYTNSKMQYETYERWKDEEREKTRTRANYYAKMQYEEFTKSEYYKNLVALNILTDTLTLLSVLLIFLTPVYGYLFHGPIGILGGILIIFVTVHYWAEVIFHNKVRVDINEIFSSFVRIVKTKTFQVLFFSLLNIILIYKIGFNTFITLSNLFLIYTLSVISGLLVSSKLSSSYLKNIISLAVCPGIINLFLLVNYTFSSNPVTETYSFVHEMRWYGGKHTKVHLEKIAYINLENDKYRDFAGLRMFADFEAMKDANKITYVFEEGFFGIRVLKSFRFNR